MASFPPPFSDGTWAGGMKRPRSEVTGFAPSPTDAIYLASPFLVDESQIASGHPLTQSVDDFLDAKAILNDFVLLSSTGHCLFESLSRGISQKIWVMNNNQRGTYFEKLAWSVRSNQQDTDIQNLVLKFCKGVPNWSNLGQMLLEAHSVISKNIDAITSMPSPGYGYINSKSPWTMYTTGDLVDPRQGSSTSSFLDEKRWVTPSIFTPSLTVEQNLDIRSMQSTRIESSDDGSRTIMDKTNARKKTVSALNRMKQFVVPSSSETGSVSGNSVMSDSPHVSPSMQSLATLPNFPFNVRASFPMQQMYPHSGAMGMNLSPNIMISPPESMMIGAQRVNISPDAGMQEAVVCRRKKPRVSDSAGPKGVSKTGSTWRIQVQVRGGIIVDSFGNSTERKKYRFSRYVSDYVEALWMYEVAILLSDRPKDLATQMENGNYRVLLENKIVSSPDKYYLELGVRVSAFAHAERGRDDNSERMLAIQAYDLMKPTNGLSLAELGQTIVSLGPMYSNISRMDQSR